MTFLLVVEKKRTGIAGNTSAASVLSEWILLEQMTEHHCNLTMAGNCNVGDCSGVSGPKCGKCADLPSRLLTTRVSLLPEHNDLCRWWTALPFR